jgi:hypothetical protein
MGCGVDMVFGAKTHANPLCCAKACAFFYIGRNCLACWQGSFAPTRISARSSIHSVALHSFRFEASKYFLIDYFLNKKGATNCSP